jgi:hypothetical protein
MVYILVAIAVGLAVASFTKTKELEQRITELERKVKWWY